MSTLRLETVELTRSDRVAWIVLNRPEALNAWTTQLGEELSRARRDGPRPRGPRDRGDRRRPRLLRRGGPEVRLRDSRPTARPDVRLAAARGLPPADAAMRTIPKPVIAAVNGPAVGIGCSFALAADLIVAARSAYFLLAFVNIGLGLDGGASQSLVARVGSARAFEIAYLGERIGAEQALAWNLVNEVVDDDAARAAHCRARHATGRRTARVLRDDQAHDQRPCLRRIRASCSTSRPICSRSGRRQTTSARASWRSCRSARPTSTGS